MNIAYDAAYRIFKLDTDHTSYVIAVIDEEGFLCHAYYGDKISDTDVAYLLRTGEHPFVPSRNNRDRSRRIYVKGLLADGLYQIEGQEGVFHGDTLMCAGINAPGTWGDYQSRLIHIITADK